MDLFAIPVLIHALMKKIQIIIFLSVLENIIRIRKNNPDERSYTSSLFKKGINKIAQKVGEEASRVSDRSKR